MTEEKNKSTPSHPDQYNINNLKDRDALKRAADDFLKKHKTEEKGEAIEEEAEKTNPLTELQTENRELKDQLLRLSAEMENLRKRTTRDIHDIKTYSVANFARDMLSVSDNLRRALDAIPEDAFNQDDNGLKALAEGVEMTERSMLSALERHSVKKIEPKGQKFDPHFHQAMFEIPNADVPSNTILQVVQAGFVIGDRVLRPALVGISRGGPKAQPTEEVADANLSPLEGERDA